ncbi:uncharacterized protein LOC111044715 isoform X2 [Nilaparvata lugens]|uniref:uncharacterized protein LOC111044715 isoform X2 n=1 Tax=Nilaparvata lugens TaxID=108931 RepID=UPI00193DC309|nr:uncharacterized protein LOC111044715 isoform X2 [Nilaparvata lugens]XP_039279598.1 uncharacterized protein LOC111044715 isoform X2 [Nilaparvata lugens]
MTVQKLSAPDGGWGWLVVLGSSLINLATRSIEPSFGLLFGDLLKELGVATTGASIIMSTLDAIINFSGLFVGPLIKKYSFRKVGLFGVVLSSIALISTSTATSMTHIILTYSILGGLGFGLATAATFVALNAYFDKRRGQAVGLAMAGTAFGFMAMPQLISRLLEEYDFRGTLFILGALSLNGLVGASLLQPVTWHMKASKPNVPLIREEPAPAQDLQEEADKKAHMCLRVNSEKEMSSQHSALLGSSIVRKTSVASDMHRQMSMTSTTALQNRSVAGDLHRQMSMTSTTAMQNRLNAIAMPRNVSVVSIASKKRKQSVISNVSHLDLMASTTHIHFYAGSDDELDASSKNLRKSCDLKNGSVIGSSKLTATVKQGCWAKIAHLMDLDLLKDGIYLNILFGLSITYIAEMNFKLVIPFFMANMGYSKRETAMALSIMATADITARVTVPPILDRSSFSRRKTLMLGCLLVAISRSVLAEQTQWIPLVICLVIHGFFRGVVLINFPLVISEYVPVDKFAAAYGLSMVSKGIFIVLFGPVPGYIRDLTDSYPICIHVQSFMILLCIIAWSIESVLCWRQIEMDKEQDVADMT